MEAGCARRRILDTENVAVCLSGGFESTCHVPKYKFTPQYATRTAATRNDGERLQTPFFFMFNTYYIYYILLTGENHTLTINILERILTVSSQFSKRSESSSS